MIVKCARCDKEFSVKPSRVKRSKNVFCSTECHNDFRHEANIAEMSEKVGCDFKQWLIDRYHGDLLSLREVSVILYGSNKLSSSVGRWLDKLGIELRHGSDAVKTQWKDADERRKLSAKLARENLHTPAVRVKLKAAQQTPEYNLKSSLSKKGDKNPMYQVMGSRHPQWNPKLTPLERVLGRKTVAHKTFRIGVFERDNYTCQKCGDKTGGNLRAHHVVNHHADKKLRFVLTNGITFCDPCHRAFHKKYGYKDNDRAQLDEYLIN